MVRVGASTGGVDLVGLIIKHFFPHLSVATIMFVINAALLIISRIVFKCFAVTFYSVAAVFVSEKITELVLNVGISAKSVLIISDYFEDIEQLIKVKYERGVTKFYSEASDKENQKVSLFCVATPKEVSKIARDIREVDRKAFLAISDVKEVMGKGFTDNEQS